MLTFALDRLGWFSFEELCRTICRQAWGYRVETYTRGPDQGMDGLVRGAIVIDGHERPAVLQCKHTSKPGTRLSRSSFASELDKIAALRRAGMCDRYILMTNMTVSTAVANTVRADVRERGVPEVEVYGYEGICEVLSENRELRALVPRLYGLGDLTEILDERAYAQAREVLSWMHDDLARIVPIEAQRVAASRLQEHGVVALIGPPGSGKTSVAASLVMGAIDVHAVEPVLLSTVNDLAQHWNPHRSQILWLDDAFGTTQYRVDLAEAWNRELARVRAAIGRGSRLIITSRDYIWSAAQRDLKGGLVDLGRATVRVDDLSHHEREQILYNHLKMGRQPAEVLRTLDPAHLSFATRAEPFLPELARRLADPAFTINLDMSNRSALVRFFSEPNSYLREVLTTLNRGSQAAIGLVHRRGGILGSPVQLDVSDQPLLTRLGCTLDAVADALLALEGSLVQFVAHDSGAHWEFKHPSIGDAYAAWMAEDPELLGEYVKTVRLDEVLRTVTCGDVGLEGAVVVGRNLYPDITERILEHAPTSKWRQDFWDDNVVPFLARRCTTEYLIELTSIAPEVVHHAFSVEVYASAFDGRALLAETLLRSGIANHRHRQNLRTKLVRLAGEDLDGTVLTSWWSLLLDDEDREAIRALARENLRNLEDYVREHLSESWGDTSTAYDLVNGFEELFGNDPDIRRARDLIAAWEEYEPDEDFLRHLAVQDIGVSVIAPPVGTTGAIFSDLAD